MSGFVYLTDEVLEGLGLTPAEIADCIEEAVRAEAAGTLWTAPKAGFLPGDGRYMMVTLAAADQPDIVAVKSVMVSPRNPERGLPGINGAIMLLDSETGLLRAVMGANWVTAVRTAGLSAVAARRLADPASRSVAFIGCGVQALSHLDAIAAMFPLNEIRAFGRGRANIDRLCAAAKAKGLEARACDTPREAVEGADLVVSSVTLNHGLDPFVDAGWLKPGAFAAILDIARPWMPGTMGAFGCVVIDSLAQEAATTTKMVDPALVTTDLSGLVCGAAPPIFDSGRRAAFIFRGIAVGDIALAGLAWRRAVAAGKGVRVDG